MFKTIRTLLVGSAVAVSLAPLPSLASEGADFFKGKTVTYIVPTAAGGGYDYYGRMAAEFMQRHLPGSTFVVKNMPGAGHIIGVNAIASAKPDGLTLGIVNQGLIYNQLVGTDGIRFDLSKLSWIGKAAADPRVFVISALSPIKTFSDLKSGKNVPFSSCGVGCAAYVETKLLAYAMPLSINLMPGYNGNEDQMAMRRGEIVGTFASRSSADEFVKNGYAHYVAQVGGGEKDVPQLLSFADNPEAKAIVTLIQSQGEMARLTAGTPGIPAPQLEALRAAYKASMEDKELQERAAKGGRPVEPIYGDDVLKMVNEALSQSPQTVNLLKDALTAK